MFSRVYFKHSFASGLYLGYVGLTYEMRKKNGRVVYIGPEIEYSYFRGAWMELL